MRRGILVVRVVLVLLVGLPGAFGGVAWAQAPAASVRVEPDTATVGQRVVVDGRMPPLACGPVTDVRMTVGGALLGVASAGPEGAFRLAAPVPDVAAGRHALVARCAAGGAEVPVELARTDLTVAPAATAGPTTGPPPGPGTTAATPGTTGVLPPRVAPPRTPRPTPAPRTSPGPARSGGATVGAPASGAPGPAASDGGGAADVPGALPVSDRGEDRALGRAAADGVPDPGRRWGPAAEIGRITDPDVTAAGAAAAAAAVLLFSLLIGFPATMFDGTLRAHYDDLVDEARRRAPRLAERATALVSAVPSSPLLGAAVAGGLVSAAADDGIGLDGRSLAIVAALGATVGLASWLGWWPTKRTSDQLGNDGRYRVYPAALFVAVGCVLLTRYGNLHPGYLYGLLFAYETRGRWTQRHDAVTYALGFGAVLALGLLAWAGLAVTDGAVPATGEPSLAWVVVDTVLAGLTIVGVEGVVFGMLPFRFTPGGAIWRHDRRLWLVTWAPAATALVVMLSTPQRRLLSVEAETADVPRAALAFALFSAVSLSFWTWARRRAARAPRPEAVAVDDHDGGRPAAALVAHGSRGGTE